MYFCKKGRPTVRISLNTYFIWEYHFTVWTISNVFINMPANIILQRSGVNENWGI